MPFNPKFTITPQIATALMKIESVKESIQNLPITPHVLKTLRETARLYSTHYSTMIEGNRLTQKEVEGILKNSEHFKGRERDEKEIKGYYIALEWLEAGKAKALSETNIQTIHALVMGEGKSRVKPTPYRDGQNVIRDSITGAIVYMPPEAKDVPVLMGELLDWFKTKAADLPCPIAAAIAHYQYATIHPYYDGNGRTARLLTSLVLHDGGYGLKGLYALEEYYAENLQGYYNALNIGEHHNYYMGRAEADITPWIEYFIMGMQEAFERVKARAVEASERGQKDQSKALRDLTPRQRKVLSLFESQAVIVSKDIETLFGFSPRSARKLCGDLVDEGFLTVADPAKKSRQYRLAGKYEKMI